MLMKLIGEFLYWTSEKDESGFPFTTYYCDDGFGNLVKVDPWPDRRFRHGTTIV